MLKKFEFKDLDWIDLESPTHSDIHEIRESYDVDNFIVQDLHDPSLRSRIDFSSKHIYLVLHFPIYSREKKQVYSREVDIVIGEKYLITTHYEQIKELHEISDIYALENVDDHPHKETHAGHLFFYIMRHLYVTMEENLGDISDRLEKIEAEIFAGNEHEMVRSLSDIGRELLDFKKALRSHTDVIGSYESVSSELFGKKYSYYATSILGEYRKIHGILDAHTELLGELRDTNDSLLSTKSGDIMKFLTIMAFVTFPLSLLAGVFGMNTINTPIIGSSNDFWVILGIMVLATVGFFMFFKYKKWL